MPLIPRVGPGEVIPLRPVRPDDVGGGIGQAAYAGAAQDLGAASARLIGAEREAQVAGAEAGYGSKLAELTQAIDQHPNADEREGLFEEGRKKLTEEFRGTLTGEQYQQVFDQRAFQLGERAKLAVREGVIRKRLDTAKGGVIEAVDKFDRLIEHSESDQLTKGYIFARSNILDAGVQGGSISASERANIEERSRAALEQVELRKTSQQKATDIFAEYDNPSARLKAARDSITDPQMLDQTVARLKDMNQEAEFARHRAQEYQADEYWKRFHKGELTRTEVVNDPTLPAPLRNALMSDFDAREVRQAKQPPVVRTDPAAKADMIDLYTNPRRADEAAKKPYWSLPGPFSAADRETARKLSIGEFDKQEPLINAKTNERIRAYLQAKKTATPAEAEQAIQYRQAVGEAIESERLRLGRVNLSDDEIDAVVDKQIEFAIPAYDSYFFDPFHADTEAVPRYQVPGQFTLGVPADDHLRLQTKFQAAGLANPSDEAIRRAYIDELEGGK